MSDTVKIHISIEISTEDEADTGYTVEQWNAMTDTDRRAFVSEMWSTYASNADGGGISVITDGAEGV